MSFDAAPAQRFTYESFTFDADQARLECHYRLDELAFTEVIEFGFVPSPSADAGRMQAAARMVFLLAGVSYYKAAAPPLVDFAEFALTPAEAELLKAFYLDGLGEYAYRNQLDLRGLAFEYSDSGPPPRPAAPPTDGGGRVLVPFGGGIDSIVTVELLRGRADDAALFVVGRDIAAIEAPAHVTGLPVRRATRRLDPQILRSRELGFRNGHVPITGILSAIAVLAAALDGRDAVVMSNEWSASRGNVVVEGREINHQFSKSHRFEALFRAALADSVGPSPDYFSLLRPLSELRIAQLFAQLPQYHRQFRSCNRAFYIDPEQRLARWCGTCDKCCFIDLILAPFLDASTLTDIFDGREPLANERLLGQFLALLGANDDPKPFECVGDVDECRAALLLTGERADRASHPLVSTLRDRVPSVPATAALLEPIGTHFVPKRYASFAFMG